MSNNTPARRPVALRAAQASGVAFEPLAMAIAIAASCEFTTPIGYQTNLMVQGPGGYRLGDYLRFGGPLTLICGVVAGTLLAALYFVIGRRVAAEAAPTGAALARCSD